MKTILFLILIVSISSTIHSAAEQTTQSSPWNELPCPAIESIGRGLEDDHDLLNFALVSRRIHSLSLGNLTERKATALLRYWKNQPQCIFNQQNEIASISRPVKPAFSREGHLLAYGTASGFKMMDIKKKETVAYEFLGDSCCDQLAFAKPDPTHLQLIDYALNHVVCRWAVNKGNPAHYSLTKIDDVRIVDSIGITAVAFSPDGTQTAFGGPHNRIRTRDRSGHTREKEIEQIYHNKFKVTALCFSNDQNQIAIGDNEGKVTVWNLINNDTKIMPACEANWAKAVISSVDISPDGKRVAASLKAQHARRGGIIEWDLAARKVLYSKDDTGAVACAVFSPDGKIIAYTTPNRGVVLIDAESGVEINTIPCKSPTIVKFSPSGKRIAVVLWYGSLSLLACKQH